MFILFLLKTGKNLQKHNGNIKLVFFPGLLPPPPHIVSYGCANQTTFTGSDSSDPFAFQRTFLNIKV